MTARSATTSWHGVVALLGRWAKVWGDRPVAVVPVPSRSRPTLVVRPRRTDRRGRDGCPVVDALRASGPAPAHGSASKGRVEAVQRRLSLDPDVALPAGPVLLVDDYAASGWTLTVAAALLREAGAETVFPLVLHRRAG